MSTPAGAVQGIRDWAQWLPKGIQKGEELVNKAVPDSVLNMLGMPMQGTPQETATGANVPSLLQRGEQFIEQHLPRRGFPKR